MNELTDFVLGRLSAFQASSEIDSLDFCVPCEEEFVFETEHEYVAMVSSKIFNSVEFLIGKPYIYKGDSDAGFTYGWSFNGSTRLIENAYKPCNPCWEDELVVAFSKYQ